MDVTILLMWIIVLLILHILVEKSLQMKKIAESFMNTNQMRTRTTLEQDVNALPVSMAPSSEDSTDDSMESDLLNFLMNGDPALSKQMEDGEDEVESQKPMVGEYNLINHTNIINEKSLAPEDKRYQLNSGKFANLDTFDSIVCEGSEQFCSPM